MWNYIGLGFAILNVVLALRSESKAALRLGSVMGWLLVVMYVSIQTFS